MALTPDRGAAETVSGGERHSQHLFRGWSAPSVDRKTIKNLVDDIDANGYAQIDNFIPQDVLLSAKEFVQNTVTKNNNEYVGLVGRNAVEGTVMEALSRSPEFNRMLRDIYEAGTGQKAPEQNIYQVVRCLKGRTGLVHNFYFHYDSYVVTALLPIEIPTSGRTGDLFISMKRRKLHKMYIRNLVDKVIMQNKFSQRLLKRWAENGQQGFKRVKITPGNIYFFWGYNTCHANEPCEIENLRATALFHFGDPYTDSKLRKLTGKAELRENANPLN